MLALPGLQILLAIIYVRPQEFVEQLRAVPLLYVALALALAGLVGDLRLRLARAESSPLLPWAILLWAWCLLGVGLRERSAVTSTAVVVGVDVALYLAIAHGVQTFRGLARVGATLLALALFVALVAVHQGFAPLGCHVTEYTRDELVLKWDGRPCQTAADCRVDDPEPGADYRCEHVGLFDTSSLGGRVRYRGRLGDSNDLSLAVGVALPFAFALFERRRSLARLLVAGVALAAIGLATVLAQSRGGQLVFATVLGAYFARRFGWKGIALGAVAALPILMFGGRGGEEALSSTTERVDSWYEGVSMFVGNPLIGVGQGRFVEHHYLTAHNSYLLAAAELGLPGLVLWSILIYLAVKTPVIALGRLAGVPGEGAATARAWAMALLASSAGLLVGIFFLSFCYHPVLWICLGMAGAFSSAMRTHDPEWRVRFGLRDLALVLAGDALVLAVVFVYSRMEVPG